MSESLLVMLILEISFCSTRIVSLFKNTVKCDSQIYFGMQQCVLQFILVELHSELLFI